MAARYLNPIARERMAIGRCPECGSVEQSHGGWGGPKGCSLTDNGVAGRVHQYRQDLDPANLTKGEREGLATLGRRGYTTIVHPRVANSLCVKGLATRTLGYDLEITDDGRAVLAAIAAEHAEHEAKYAEWAKTHGYTNEES